MRADVAARRSICRVHRRRHHLLGHPRHPAGDGDDGGDGRQERTAFPAPAGLAGRRPVRGGPAPGRRRQEGARLRLPRHHPHAAEARGQSAADRLLRRALDATELHGRRRRQQAVRPGKDVDLPIPGAEQDVAAEDRRHLRRLSGLAGRGRRSGGPSRATPSEPPSRGPLQRTDAHTGVRDNSWCKSSTRGRPSCLPSRFGNSRCRIYATSPSICLDGCRRWDGRACR